MQSQRQFGTGLRLTPPDNRDFKLKKLLGAFDVSKLPVHFELAKPIKIKDQGDTDFCAAYALTAVSEVQEGIELSPLWQFAKIKQLEGDWQTWGADLRMACKSAIKFGSLPEVLSPYKAGERSRDFLANWANWDSNLDLSALYHAKKSFWRVEDGFDGFRTAMYLNKSAILTGVIWCNEWTYAEKGIINKKGTPTEGHAIGCTIGWTLINGKQYMIFQNSYSDSVGDHGLYYFRHDLVDKLFVYGGFAFVDLSPAEAKHIAWSVQIRIVEKIKYILTQISDAFKQIFNITKM